MHPEEIALQLTLKAIENGLIKYPHVSEGEYVGSAKEAALQVSAFYNEILSSVKPSK